MSKYDRKIGIIITVLLIFASGFFIGGAMRGEYLGPFERKVKDTSTAWISPDTSMYKILHDQSHYVGIGTPCNGDTCYWFQVSYAFPVDTTFFREFPTREGKMAGWMQYEVVRKSKTIYKLKP